MKKANLWALVLTIGIITLFISFWKGQVDINVLRYAGAIVGGLTVVLWIFNRYVWHWRLFFPYLVSVPDVRGKWDGVGHIAVPPDAKAEFLITETVIDQKYSGVKMRITFKDGAITEFLESAPIAVSGKETLLCSFATFYNNTMPGKLTQFRTAQMSFVVNAERFKKPKKIVIHYSTTDGVIGQLELNKKQK